MRHGALNRLVVEAHQLPDCLTLIGGQGFNIALIPDGDDPRVDIVPAGMRALRAPTIVEALEHVIDIADHRGGKSTGPRRLDA